MNSLSAGGPAHRDGTITIHLPTYTADDGYYSSMRSDLMQLTV
jgi:hypothetical protein